jgi:hypothetical protein
MRDGGAFGAVGDGLTLKTDPPLSAAADKDGAPEKAKATAKAKAKAPRAKTARGAPARERPQEPAERLSETGESAAIAGGAEARYNYVSVVHR